MALHILLETASEDAPVWYRVPGADSVLCKITAEAGERPEASEKICMGAANSGIALNRRRSFMKKTFRKLKRLELVELIYQLRKDNLELRRRCKDLEKQLEKSDGLVAAYASRSDEEMLGRIESMIADLHRAQTVAE